MRAAAPARGRWDDALDAAAAAARLLPLAVAAEAAALAGWDGRLLEVAPVAMRALDLCFPGIRPAWEAIRPMVGAGVLLLVAVHAAPRERRQALLAAAAAAAAALIFGPGPAALFGAAALTAWLGCRSSSFRARLAALVPASAFLAAFCWAAPIPVRLGAFVLSVQMLFRAYAWAVDADGPAGRPDAARHFLGLSGGFPLNAWGPHYPPAALASCFLARPYAEIAARGVRLVYAGLFKIALLAALDTGLAAADVHVWGGARLTTPELWFWAFFRLAEYLLLVCGAVQLRLGLQAVFGWDVEEPCRQPWLMTSPLDMWRRLTPIDRSYMVKYVLYPSYRRFGGFMAALPIVFVSVAVVDFASALPPRPLLHPEDLLHAAAQSFVYFAAFTVLCVAEYAWQGRTLEPDAPSGFRRALRIAGAWILFAVLALPGRRGLGLRHLPPSALPVDGLAAGYAALARGLVGLGPR